MVCLGKSFLMILKALKKGEKKKAQYSLWGQWVGEEPMHFYYAQCAELSVSIVKLKGIFIMNKPLTKYLGIFNTSLGPSPYIFTISHCSLISYLNTKNKVKRMRKEMLISGKQVFAYCINVTVVCF